MGDVATLAARLVGPSGEVVGVERDPTTIAKARAGVAAGGLQNVKSACQVLTAGSPQSSAGSTPAGGSILAPFLNRVNREWRLLRSAVA
jgi:hypothetical protein